MKAEAELETADYLVTPGGSRRPSEANLNVAVVVVYYGSVAKLETPSVA